MSNESKSSSALLGRLASKKTRLKARHRIVSSIRAFFERQGFTEVETPLLLGAVAPEEHIRPMRCGTGFLATSPELQMKQLVAAGMERVFQLTRSFRSGEQGLLHSPEFSILEWYRPGKTIHALVRDLEQLFRFVAANVLPETRLVWKGRTIELAASWPVTTVRDAFREYAGWDPVDAFDADRFDLDLVEKVEPELGRGRPEILAYYPSELGSLSRPLPDDLRLSQRMELYVEGLELANGFVELNDADEQRTRFERAAAAIEQDSGERPRLPEGFLASLDHLPDCVGIALGVDRLVMLFTGAASLDEVCAFASGDT